ncbi:hypothetical protein HDV00_010643 [Rhizophlyctis rosea]|nr:hypothetical protein HDV00_010643 [Rhizophlyctis rosea]
MTRYNTLFVHGLSPKTRAEDLAYDFGRSVLLHGDGDIVRVDIPALPTYKPTRFAFVEYDWHQHAEKAWKNMHGKKVDGYEICVEWAKSDGPRCPTWDENRNKPDNSDHYSPPRKHSSRYDRYGDYGARLAAPPAPDAGGAHYQHNNQYYEYNNQHNQWGSYADGTPYYGRPLAASAEPMNIDKQ